MLDQAANVWREDRESYPGWIMCPSDCRHDLRIGTDTVPTPNQARLANLKPERRSQILYEVAWRHATALWPVDAHLAALLGTIASPAEDCGIAKRQQAEVAAILLRRARIVGDNDAFERWASVLETYNELDADLRAEASYQRALRARDRLDFKDILVEADRILAGRDPIWKVRVAALHCERGEFPDAHRLIGEALRELQERQREDRRSLWIRSRRAWVQWLARAARLDRLERGKEESWSLEFKEAQCDPWEELEGLHNEMQKALRKRREE